MSQEQEIYASTAPRLAPADKAQVIRTAAWLIAGSAAFYYFVWKKI